MAGSLEKTRLVVEALIDEKLPPPLAAMAAPMIELPETDAELDAKLLEYIEMLLGLRSDGLPELSLVPSVAV